MAFGSRFQTKVDDIPVICVSKPSSFVLMKGLFVVKTI